MPFYEYRPKSGACEICGGCFVDLQKMSDAAHVNCPDCNQACERVLSAPIVSVRGAEYRAAANAENRAASYARASTQNAVLREATLKKYNQLNGHTHNCALAGCYGSEVQKEVLREETRGGTPGTTEVINEGENGGGDVKPSRFGGLPHLVGLGKK